MERKPGTQTVCGVEILPEQRTPLVEALLGVIDQLRATVQQQQMRIDQLEEEIRRLKGLPDQPKRKPGPSPLNDPSGPPSASAKKKKPNTPDGKRPGSAKRSKTRDLVIHNDVPLLLDDLPDGTRVPRLSGFHRPGLAGRAVQHVLPPRPLPTAGRDDRHRSLAAGRHVAFRSDAQAICALPAFSQPRHPAAVARGVAGTGGGHLGRPDQSPADRRARGVLPGERQPAAGRPRGLGVSTNRRHLRQAPGQSRAHAAHRQRFVRLLLHDRHQEPGELPEDSAHASSGLPVQRRRLVLPGMFRAPPKTPRATESRHGLALRRRRILGGAARCLADHARRNTGGC